MKIWGGALALVIATAAAGQALAADDGFELTGLVGFDYSSGDYGTGIDTNILRVPLGLRATTGPLRLTASIPYERIEGAANIISGDGGGPIIVDPSAPIEKVTREGWGDLALGASYTLPASITGALEVDLNGRVKLPTGDDELSTGETDYSVGTEASYPLGAWTPFASLGYKMRGDPEGVDLDNTINASIGTSYAVTDRSVVIVSYDYDQASTSGVDDSHSLFAGYSAPLVGRVNWTIYGVAGLSDGAPDAEGGLLLSVPFL
ncbi:MAG TPA: transporter [Caulobacteraceae bacterium]